jgi:hypothetical protein
MKRIAPCLVLLLASLAAPAAEPGRLAVVELSGTPRERGIQHGKALKKEIAEHVRRWKASVARETKGDADAAIAAFLKETSFEAATRTWTPDLLEEIRGLAEGSRQPYDTMWAFQLVDEIWVWMDQRAGHHCSGAGASKRGDKPAFVAQNMDVEGFRDGFQTLLHIAPSAGTPEQYVFTAAGVVALNGMNASGVGLVVNTLSQLRSAREGLPVAFVVRGVLSKTSADDAVRFLTNVKHASGQNYLLGAGDRVFDFEASASKVVQASEGSELLWHTNHPIANDDYRDWWKEWLRSHDRDGVLESNSGERFQAVARRLAGRVRETTAEDAKAALRSKDSEANPVCRSRTDERRSFTFGSVVMTLSGTPFLEVAAGPPDVNPYRRFELKAR